MAGRWGESWGWEELWEGPGKERKKTRHRVLSRMTGGEGGGVGGWVERGWGGGGGLLVSGCILGANTVGRCVIARSAAGPQPASTRGPPRRRALYSSTCKEYFGKRCCARSFSTWISKYQ